MLKDKKVIIWDLDNTLYRVTDDFGHKLDETMAIVATKHLGVDLSFEEALEKVKESFSKYRDGGEIFYNEYDVDIKDFYDLYHENVPYEYVKPFEGLKEKLESLDAKQYIFTYSSADLAKKILQKLDLCEIFKDTCYSVEDFNTYKKNDSKDVYLDLCKKIGYKPEECLFVDDSYSNLTFAGEAGMSTVRIYYNNISSKHKGNADFAFTDVFEFIEEYKK